ncbi:type 1 glutamine amidotransferase domain-containing protein [Couchioplanes azureus]|uniref:type 1 glutamine amidotransferase domain-containing protein n=1 Tax=Couchioplanes caeruleus TaxID=56438 RepID=UPI0016717566|nr:type 1 glutamine amidotransferase domain-containing protein [Couchioplanes caeruleus]GGQ71652.1 dimethylallyltransferase [Couchioplanes caeruleus subsp. azureus]
MSQVLFVMTGADRLTLADGTTHPTGFWAEEFLAPYRAVTAAGHEVVVATPGGVAPPVDRASLDAEDVGAQLAAVGALEDPVRLEDVDPARYAAVFYPGGHGPMEDLARDPASAAVIRATMAAGKPLAVVCHGVAALLATAEADGGWPFAGYRLTGFSNVEETAAGLAGKLSWLLEDRLTGLGAQFSAGEPWASHVVVDRNLYSGQNPGSSQELATAFTAALR